jgi:hypothetical protein
MKPGFDQVRAVKAWLDEIAELSVTACHHHWKRNAYAALYLWYRRSKPGTWGQFKIATDYAPPAPDSGWELASNERLRWTLNRSQLWQQVREIINRLPVLEPSDMDAQPPKAQVWDDTEAEPPAEPCKHPTAFYERPGVLRCPRCQKTWNASPPLGCGAPAAPAPTEAEPLSQPDSTVVMVQYTDRQSALEF